MSPPSPLPPSVHSHTGLTGLNVGLPDLFEIVQSRHKTSLRTGRRKRLRHMHEPRPSSLARGVSQRGFTSIERIKGSPRDAQTCSPPSSQWVVRHGGPSSPSPSPQNVVCRVGPGRGQSGGMDGRGIATIGDQKTSNPFTGWRMCCPLSG